MASVLARRGDLALVSSEMGITVHMGMTVGVEAFDAASDFAAVDGFFDALSSAAWSGKLYAKDGRVLHLSSSSLRTVQDWNGEYGDGQSWAA